MELLDPQTPQHLAVAPDTELAAEHMNADAKINAWRQRNGPGGLGSCAEINATNSTRSCAHGHAQQSCRCATETVGRTGANRSRPLAYNTEDRRQRRQSPGSTSHPASFWTLLRATLLRAVPAFLSDGHREGVVQDALTLLLQECGGCSHGPPEECPLPPLGQRIVHDLAVDRLRRARRARREQRVRTEIGETLQDATEQELHTAVLSTDLQRHWEWLEPVLPPGQAEVFRFYLAGVTDVDEIALLSGRSPKAVRRIITRLTRRVITFRRAANSRSAKRFL